MQPAAPSLAEASRSLPSVKTGEPPADDDLVTSVAYVRNETEPVSPELALVDPSLAERLRADLGEAEPEQEPESAAAPPVELTVEPAPAPVVVPVEVPLEVPLEPEPPVEPLPAPVAAGVPVLRPVVPSVDEPEPVARATPVAQRTAAAPASAHRPASVSPLRSRSPFWRVLVVLATLVLFAGVVTVGVMVVSGLTDGDSDSNVTAGPAAVAPSAEPEPPASPAPTDDGAPPPRRFAWAPVEGAVSYRFELFRGDEQVLRATTSDPAYELPRSWRHDGREQTLTSGSYRWYVWPVLASGPADAAIVQADLDVP